ncbi:hypothetical protein INR49_016392, partial [Caranx melampygus]
YSNCDFILPAALQVIQKPRFYGVKAGCDVLLFCSSTEAPASVVQWYRGRINVTTALHHSGMKDGLIIFQGLLLAVTIAAMLLRKQTLWENSDSIYKDPETDHIYEVC